MNTTTQPVGADFSSVMNAGRALGYMDPGQGSYYGMAVPGQGPQQMQLSPQTMASMGMMGQDSQGLGAMMQRPSGMSGMQFMGGYEPQLMRSLYGSY